MALFRRLLGLCHHAWVDEPMAPVDEILSSRDWSMQRCEKCNQVRYRKL